MMRSEKVSSYEHGGGAMARIAGGRIGLLLCFGCTPPAGLELPSPATAPPRPTLVPAPPTVPIEPPQVGPSRVVHDRDFLPAARLAIGAAQTRIRVAEFLLSPGTSVDDLLQALIQATERGVHVQVMADEEGANTRRALDRLNWVGIEARFDGPARTLHNKLIIADDVVLVGSHNFTGAALDRNHEGGVLVNDAEVAQWYASWFDAVWLDPVADPGLPPLQRTDLIPLADGSAREAVVACLEQANERVDLLMYAIAWNEAYPGGEVDQVLGALEGAAGRGVAVRVVLDGSDWIVQNAIDDAAIERLRLAGIPVWRTPASVTTHAKVLRCDEQLVIGDMNWSYSGMVLMHGTSLLTRDPAMLQATEAWMRGVRQGAVELP